MSRSRLTKAILVLALGGLGLGQPAIAAPSPGKFAGVPVVPGGITRASVPLTRWKDSTRGRAETSRASASRRGPGRSAKL